MALNIKLLFANVKLVFFVFIYSLESFFFFFWKGFTLKVDARLVWEDKSNDQHTNLHA